MIASVFESYVIEALQNLKSGNGESQVASLSILAAALFNCMKLAGSEKHVLLSAGKLGLIWVTETDITSQRLVSHGVHASKMGNCFVYQIPPAPIAESEIINTSGAGDTFCGTLIYYLAKSDWKGRLTLEALLYGLLGARESLKVKTAVPINLKERMPHIEYGILK